MISAFDVSTSALVAQRVRLNVISSNLANMNSIRNEDGENQPYQPRYVIFETDETQQAEGGAAAVKVQEKGRSATITAGGVTFQLFMLSSNGRFPEPEVNGNKVVIGGQTVAFEDGKITLGKMAGP